jgi:hypothetical protein
MFAFVPFYFIALSTMKSEKDIMRCINAILISGFIVAVLAIMQFVLVSILGLVEPGTSIDFATKYSSHREMRATSVLASTNELGVFLGACLIFNFVFIYFFPEYKKRHYKKLYISFITMFSALILTLSRSSIIGLTASILIISIIKKKIIPILMVSLFIVILTTFIPLSLISRFESLITFNDPYYTGTLRNQKVWDAFWSAPFLGHGFSITPTAAQKLGLKQEGVVSIGGTDVGFLLTWCQIGAIGLSIQLLLWFLFLRSSYLCAKSDMISNIYRSVSLAIFGILIGFMIVNIHFSPWECISLSPTYYLLGAISTSVYIRLKRMKRCRIL